jgi:hypothetical protein
MRYRLNDCSRRSYFEARNAEDLVRQLRLADSHRGRSRQEFMREMAKRLRAWNGTRINTSTPTLFVRGLIRTGFLQVENDRG